MDLPVKTSRKYLSRCLQGGCDDGDLFKAAEECLRERLGNAVYLRGIIEISNRCRKNCLYCGLRRDNSAMARYTIPFDEIVSALEEGYETGLRSFLLQSGELLGQDHIQLVEDVLSWCSVNIPEARMVLSLGELSFSDYSKLKKAGGDRYLLRIEVSSEELYGNYHPADGTHSYSDRLACLEFLRDTGWQTGTGVLIGLPGQSPSDLADDLLFMKDMDIDMVGMGPYIENPETPLWELREELLPEEQRVVLTLRMIALLRIMMPSINIAATTALMTLSPEGLRRGLRAGANVVMPNLTPVAYRENYNLYQGKTVVGDTLEEIMEELERECEAAGRRVILHDPGDPLHYGIRMSGNRG